MKSIVRRSLLALCLAAAPGVAAPALAGPSGLSDRVAAEAARAERLDDRIPDPALQAEMRRLEADLQRARMLIDRGERRAAERVLERAAARRAVIEAMLHRDRVVAQSPEARLDALESRLDHAQSEVRALELQHRAQLPEVK